MGPIVCPETSVRNYHHPLRKIPEGRRSHLRPGGSPKSPEVLNLAAFVHDSKLS